MTQNIELTLDSSIIYVSGTVNEKDYTFTLKSVEGVRSFWTAEVDRATPDVYHCQITAIDAQGNTAAYVTTLYYGLNLITDRTQEDVERVKELNSVGFSGWTATEVAEYLADMKGAYNASDLNRVESAVNYVFDRLKANGYDYPESLTIKNTWQISEFMPEAETKRYLANVQSLRDRFTLPEWTPEVPADMDGFTYQEANDIERILEIIDEYITKIEQNVFYSAELYGGEV